MIVRRALTIVCYRQVNIVLHLRPDVCLIVHSSSWVYIKPSSTVKDIFFNALGTWLFGSAAKRLLCYAPVEVEWEFNG